LKNSLKQSDFEPPKLETKHLVFFPKIEKLLSPPQTPKVVPCTQTLNCQNVPIAMKTLENTQNIYYLL